MKLEGEEKFGLDIVTKALTEPLRQIAMNAGIDGGIVVNEVRNRKEGIGYDASTNQYVDMLKEGIIDPAKVARAAIQNATSVAALLLTTEASVVDKGEEKTPEPAPHQMGGMY